MGLARRPTAEITALIGDGIDRLIDGLLSEGGLAHVDAGTRATAGKIAGSRARTMRPACMSNKPATIPLPLLAAAGIAHHFELVLCADDESQRKPRPDLPLAACAHFSCAPERLLVVGDSRSDVAAARAAGCPVAAVDYGYNKGRPIADECPDSIIGRIAELGATVVEHGSCRGDSSKVGQDVGGGPM